MAQWQVPSLQWQMPSPQSLQMNHASIEFSGGINNGNPSNLVQDNQTVTESGWDTDSQPALHTRKGRTPYGTSGSAETNLLANLNTAHLVRAVGTALQYWNGTAWTSITGTFADADWDATNFDINGGVLILTNGTDNVKYWDGTTLHDLNATSAPKGQFITNDTIRAWIAKGDIIYYSGYLDATDWTSANNSGSVEFYTRNGGDITAIRSFADNNKYVWKKDSFAVILGTDYFNYVLKVISNTIGCVSFKTVKEVSTPQGALLFWLAQNDVYMFNGGYPIPIGQPIRGYLDAINQSYVSRCFAATDGYRYFLGLVTGANTQPDTFLMWDPRYNIWRVNHTSDNLRYSALLNGVWYAGDANGQTYQMDSGTSDNGTAISWSVESKDYDFGAPEAEKELYEAYVQLYVPSGSTFQLAVSTDQGATYTNVGDAITTGTAYLNDKVIIPLDTVALANWVRFKLSGTGEIKIFGMEVYYRLQPLQI